MRTLAAGRTDRAMAVFLANRQLHPDERFWTYAGLARGYAALGDRKRAIASWETALRNVPADQRANRANLERALDALVPNLILQPLVENAIKHGASKMEGTGRIALRGRIEASQLVLTVENNAPLIETSGGTGVGVRNTRARLSHLYGDEQSFQLRGVGGAAPSTIAEIRLPFHTRSDLRATAVASFA